MSETAPPSFAGIEVRRLGATGIDLEARAGRAGGLPHIVGYASVFDSPTTIGGAFGSFTEIVRPGAFARAIAEDDVRALFNHNEDHLLGRTSAGTLTLTEDRHGLRMDIAPPDTAWGRDVVEMVRRGDVTGASFGFVPVRQKWTPGPDEEAPATRELLEVRLFDVSPVTFPAYPETEVASRAVAWARRGLLGEELTEEELEAVRRLCERPAVRAASSSSARPAAQGAEAGADLAARWRRQLEAAGIAPDQQEG